MGDAEYRILPLKCYQLLDKKRLTLGSASFLYEMVTPQKPLESEATFGTAPEHPIMEVNEADMMQVDPSLLEEDWGPTQEPAKSHVKPVVEEKKRLTAEDKKPVTANVIENRETNEEAADKQEPLLNTNLHNKELNQQAEFLLDSQDSPELKPIDSIIFEKKKESQVHEPVVTLEEKGKDHETVHDEKTKEKELVTDETLTEDPTTRESPKIPVNVEVPSIKTTVKRARFAEDVNESKYLKI
jgi:hypothetical protein